MRYFLLVTFAGLFILSTFQPLSGQPGSFPMWDETTLPGSYSSAEPRPKDWLMFVNAGWMGKLPDSTRLHNMSIPGTHDSCARSGGIAFEAQTWSVGMQLEAGIRYFDIRTRRTTGAGTTALAIHHEWAYQNIGLGTVLDMMVAFLRRYPREVIVIRIKGDEYPAISGSKPYEDIWPAYLEAYGAFIANTKNALPTLGELRGKIYILNDGAAFPGNHGINWDDRQSTRLQDFYHVWLWPSESRSYPHITLKSKVILIQAFIDLAQAGSNYYWTFNHLSGAGAMEPAHVASVTNNAAYNYIGPYSGQKILGTIIMDFPVIFLSIELSNLTSTARLSANQKRFASKAKVAGPNSGYLPAEPVRV